jgi:hypothetical protein
VKRAHAVAFMAALLAVACGSPSSVPTIDTLEDNRQKFTATVGDDYTFVVQHSCFCIEEERQPVRVTVRDGAVVQATELTGGTDVTARGFRTMAEFFDYVEHAIRERRLGRFDEVRVSYNEQYGYPNDIWVDESFLVADEEQGYTLSDVQPIQ